MERLRILILASVFVSLAAAASAYPGQGVAPAEDGSEYFQGFEDENYPAWEVIQGNPAITNNSISGNYSLLIEADDSQTVMRTPKMTNQIGGTVNTVSWTSYIEAPNGPNSDDRVLYTFVDHEGDTIGKLEYNMGGASLSERVDWNGNQLKFWGDGVKTFELVVDIKEENANLQINGNTYEDLGLSKVARVDYVEVDVRTVDTFDRDKFVATRHDNFNLTYNSSVDNRAFASNYQDISFNREIDEGIDVSFTADYQASSQELKLVDENNETYYSVSKNADTNQISENQYEYSYTIPESEIVGKTREGVMHELQIGEVTAEDVTQVENYTLETFKRKVFYGTLDAQTPGRYLFEADSSTEAIQVDLYGATGYHQKPDQEFANAGYSTAKFNVDPNERLYVNVGGQGFEDSSANNGLSGFNGGGNTVHTGQCNGDGGGATDIRIHQNSLNSRILVAGGSGGASNYGVYQVGGEGGGLAGGVNGYDYPEANQSNGNSFGQGAGAGSCGPSGGGGGWYGGNNEQSDGDDDDGYLSASGGAGGSGYIADQYAASADTVTGGNPDYGHGSAEITSIPESEVSGVDPLPDEPSISFSNLPENYGDQEISFEFTLNTLENGDIDVKVTDVSGDEEAIYTEEFTHQPESFTQTVNTGLNDLKAGYYNVTVEFNGVAGAQTETKKIYYENSPGDEITYLYEPIHSGEQYAVCYRPNGNVASNQIRVEMDGKYTATRDFRDTALEQNGRPEKGHRYCVYPEYKHYSVGEIGDVKVYNDKEDVLMESRSLETFSYNQPDFSEYDRVLNYDSVGWNSFEVPEQVKQMEVELFGGRGGSKHEDASYGGVTTAQIDVSNINEVRTYTPAGGSKETQNYGGFQGVDVTYWSGGEAGIFEIVEAEDNSVNGSTPLYAGGGGGSANSNLIGGDGGGPSGGAGELVDDGGGRGGMLNEVDFRGLTLYGSYRGEFDNSGRYGLGYQDGERGSADRPGGGGSGYCNNDLVQNCYTNQVEERSEPKGAVKVGFNYKSVVEDLSLEFLDSKNASFEVITSINKEYAATEDVELEVIRSNTVEDTVQLSKVSENGDLSTWSAESVSLGSPGAGYSFNVTSETTSEELNSREYSNQVVLEADGFWGEGEGTEQNPFLIDSCVQLAQAEDDVYTITSDIVCNNDKWYGGEGFTPQDFSGDLNGGNNTIYNLYSDKDGNTGLFKNTVNAEIKNLKIENAEVSSSNGNAAIFSTLADSTVSNIEVINSTFESDNKVSAVAAVQDNSKIDDVEVDSSTNILGGEAAAGISAEMIEGSQINDTSVSASIEGHKVAGITADSIGGEIRKAEFIGSLSSSNIRATAGIVHTSDSTDVIESYSNAEFNDAEPAALVSQAVGTTTVTDSFSNNVYNNPDAESLMIYEAGQNSQVYSSYTANSVPYQESYEDGDLSEVSDWQNVYWNTDQSSYSGELTHATGLTSTEMQQQSNFEGFDFNEEWSFRSGQNNDYPVLTYFDSFYSNPEINSISYPTEVDETVDFSVSADTSHPTGKELTHTWYHVRPGGERVELGTGSATDIAIPEGFTRNQELELEVSDGRFTVSERFSVLVACIDKENCSDIPTEIEMFNPVGDTIDNEPVYFEFNLTANDGTFYIYDDYSPVTGPTGLVDSIDHSRGEESYEVEHTSAPNGSNRWMVEYVRNSDDSRYTSPKVSYTYLVEENNPPSITSLNVPDTVNEGEEFEPSIDYDLGEWGIEDVTFQWNYLIQGSPSPTLCYGETGEQDVIARIYGPYEYDKASTTVDVQPTGDSCPELDDTPKPSDDPEPQNITDSEDESGEEDEPPRTDINTEMSLLHPEDNAYLSTRSVSQGVNLTANEGQLDLIINGETVSSSTHNRGNKVHTFSFSNLSENTEYTWNLEYTRAADGQVTESPARRYAIENFPELGDSNGSQINDSEDSSNEDEPDRDDGDTDDDGQIEYPSSDIAYYDEEAQEIVYNFTVNNVSGDVDIFQGRTPDEVENEENNIYSESKSGEGLERFVHRQPVEEDELGFYYYKVRFESDLGQVEETELYSLYIIPDDLDITLQPLDDRVGTGPVTYRFSVESADSDVYLYENGEEIFYDDKKEIGIKNYTVESTVREYGEITWSVEVIQNPTLQKSDTYRVVQTEEELDSGSGGSGSGGDTNEGSESDQEDEESSIRPSPDEDDPRIENETEREEELGGTIEFANTDFSVVGTEERAFEMTNTMRNDTIVYLTFDNSSQQCSSFDFRGLEEYRDTIAYQMDANQITNVPVRISMPSDESEISCPVSADTDYGSLNFTMTADGELGGLPGVVSPVQANLRPLLGALLDEQQVQVCSEVSGNFAGNSCPDNLVTLDVQPGVLLLALFGLLGGGGFLVRFYQEKYKGKPVNRKNGGGADVASGLEPE